MGRVLPEYLSKWTTAKVRAEGVTVHPEVYVKGGHYSADSDQVVLTLSNDRKVSTSLQGWRVG